MNTSLFDAAQDRDRISVLERLAEVLEREACTRSAKARLCRAQARRIRRHYEQMATVFGTGRGTT